MSSVFFIVISIFIITIFIYIIKNKRIIIEKINNKKIRIILKSIFLLFLIFFLIKQYNNISEIIKLYDWYCISKENEKMYAAYDEMISKENVFYKDVVNNNYNNQKSFEPYIPEGFDYVEGSWDTGFVIQDANMNQYVWVPCTNKENEKIEKLKRLNFSQNPLISKDLCNNKEYENFLLSALENGGFYISRFEIGKENNKPVSKKGITIWDGVTKNEAEKIVKSMYNDINCELINGYAYDTTLAWIMKTNEVESNIIDIKKSESYITGKQNYNNIYDFVDNIMELTSETYYSNVIIRGFPYEINQESRGIISQNFGYDIENFDRFSIMENENYFTITTILGFRSVIYK